MIARVLLVGDELLGGTVADSNVATIARALGSRGVPVAGAEITGDDVDEIADAVRRLAGRCDVLVVTGGLGPTSDDLTREAIARSLDTDLAEHAVAREWVAERFRERGFAPEGDAFRRQIRIPAGCDPFPNPVGTAPGIRGRIGACRFWCLPGVPPEVTEMVGAIAAEVERLPDGFGWQRIVATAGIGETKVAERLEQGGFVPPAPVRLAYLPSPGGVRLRLSAPGGVAEEILDVAEAEIRRILGDWALRAESLPEAIVRLFAEEGATLATAESCTGGLIGARITGVPGSSSVYLGGAITYSNAAKVERLGVPHALLVEHGAVSGPVAAAMAEGALRAFGATVAVSVTGIAGPGGGTPEKPVGTVWIAVADAAGSDAERFRFLGSREMVRERAAQKALESAYRRIAARGSGRS